MTQAVYKRVAILGLGLIGGSVARALAEKGLATHIAAYNHSERALDYALKTGFIHSAHQTAGEAVKDADIVVLATPPQAFAGLMQEIAIELKPGAIVTDVGSVKQSAIAAIMPYLPPHAHYVPAHPIAGSEKTGAEASAASLFSGKKVILTPEEADLRSEPVNEVRDFWERIGAKVEFMPAALHDLIYAYVSHLPQAVAFAVAPLIDRAVTDDKYVRFTRLTRSDAALWADIYIENADCVGHAIDDLLRFTMQIHGELKANPPGEGEAGNPAMLFAALIGACLIATASLLQEQAGINPVRYAGTGFADMTAARMDDPQLLLSKVSAANHTIAPLLGQMIARLQQVRNVLAQKDKQALTSALQ
ncbi:MAG TPA: prephenate dehydrogenase/arogenate dehydrogenase family protein [Rickettsiales bacterium]|nr:prephenate dehydrogenase/arogenate dehydrogenase family protein [Rickettsiales bacterium]